MEIILKIHGVITLFEIIYANNMRNWFTIYIKKYIYSIQING